MNRFSVTLAPFAKRHRLRPERDDCGETIVRGPFGHLYEHAPGIAGLALEDIPEGPSRGRALLARRRRALASGFRLHQTGDVEAILLFGLGIRAQERMAIRLVGAKQRRIASAAQLETLRRAREAFKLSKNLAQRQLQVLGTRNFRSKAGKDQMRRVRSPGDDRHYRNRPR